MALPKRENIITMDYAFNGQPFVNIPAKTSMGLESIDYAFNAQPFWATDFSGGAPPSYNKGALLLLTLLK